MALEDQSKAAAALQQLRDKLLDLTARNKLLNYRHTSRSCLRVTDELPDQLLDVLLDNKELRFDPVPAPTREKLIEFGYMEVDEETQEDIQLKNTPSAKEWSELLGMTAHFDLPDSPLAAAQQQTISGYEAPAIAEKIPQRYKDNSIQTLLFPEDLESCLRTLQRKTDLAVQEMGTNVLFLAFGFLEWFDSDTAERGRIAPLLLLPVNIRKDKLNAKSNTFEYLLSYSGEDITPNLSLREKLKADFSLVLPDLPSGENIGVEAYFNEVNEMLQAASPRWNIKRNATLGLFNFHKLLMYLDLDPARWPDGKPLIGHPVIAQFLGGSQADQLSGGGLASEEYEIDRLENVHDKYPLVFDADSSQHSAIVEVMDGKSLVIEGPPGTGKSQSISNLIAASIANGKRVLFVAEKLAALEVVKRRLDSAGLGDFVLELHSHKTQKRQLLDSIDQRLQMHRAYKDPERIDEEIQKYERYREELSAYVELINSEWKDTSLTVFEIFTTATRYRDVSSPLLGNWNGASVNNTLPNDLDNLYSRESREQQLAEINNYVHVFSSTIDQVKEYQQGSHDSRIYEHPWYGVENRSLYSHDAASLVEGLQGWQNEVDQAASLTVKIARKIGCGPQEVAGSLEGLYQLATELRDLSPPKGTINTHALSQLVDREKLESCKEEFLLFDSLAKYRKSLLPNALRNLENGIIDGKQLAESGSTLSSRVVGDLTIYQAQRLTGVIERMDGEMSALNIEMAKSIAGMPAQVQTQLVNGSAAALSKCRLLLSSVDGLDPRLRDLRQRHKGIGRLKQPLLDLQRDIADARDLHKRVKNVLNTRRFGDYRTIELIYKDYKQAGAFSWFDREWRHKRKSLQELGAHESVDIDDIVEAIPDGIELSKLHRKLVDNHEYTRLLSDDYRGVNTDIDGLLSLANWHEVLERNWGEENTAWISAIEEMNGDTESKLRELLDSDALGIISDIEKDLASVRGALHRTDTVADEQTYLVGRDGALETLRSQIGETSGVLADFFGTADISIDDVAGQLSVVEGYRENLTNWESRTEAGSTLSDVFHVDIANTSVNDEDYVQISGTFAFANHLQSAVSNEPLVKYVIQNSDRDSISELVGFADQIGEIAYAENSAFSRFSKLGKVDRENWLQASGTGFSDLESRNYAAITKPALLNGWLDYQRTLQVMQDNGLEQLIVQCELGNVSPSSCRDAWRGKIYDDLAREILREQPMLARFSGNTHRALQERFSECDKRLLELQRERLAWRADQTEVNPGRRGSYVSDLTELELLKHEVGKKKKHIPIRQLIARAPQALMQLKPCFMMGPLSAAQYLTPGQLEFDLVVMDEASQIKPQDALGVIARGKQLVVVGDPKQLPPTSFFDKVIDDDGEDETAIISQQESILDATEPMFNTRRLRWHYRSRHESLIAFSNYHFYDSNLVVFPSPVNDSEEFGIKHFPVEGVFENRANIAEANTIAQAVKSHLIQFPNDSIGVVAMNKEQSDLIDATIESLTREDPLLLDAISKKQHSNEPVFTKNLESVQGDERDVIVISMTYGPKEVGMRVMQRFGPINSADGWRRLNVLLTRSRKRMQVYSSMTSADIMVTPSSSRGVESLRDLLSFLETGILHKTRSTGKEPDSDFEISVMRRLEGYGYTCEPQVGVEGFYIDLAVKDPDSPGRYIVGIECDGATYHSAKSARDRDRLREAVLVGLGWEIRRIWSTDYFKDPNGEIDRIVRSIEKIRRREGAANIEAEETTIREPENLSVPLVSGSGESDSANLTAENSLDISMPVDTADKLEVALNKLAAEFEVGTVVPPHERLLRPDMVQALLEYKPISVAEYNALIPSFLRRSVHPSQIEYLDAVVEVIKDDCGSSS